ncbi:hypothetical protein ACMBCN_00375 [Candidatus Liberibacter asiaticus]|nr:hypothetical protein [Candidatus Liberibacter asiaticus]
MAVPAPAFDIIKIEPSMMLGIAKFHLHINVYMYIFKMIYYYYYYY